MKRGVLIWAALGVLGLVAVTGIGLFVADPERRLGASLKTGQVGGRFALEIDGAKVGALKSVTGCDIRADVINSQVAPNGVIPKDASGPKYEPCVIKVGLGMGPELLGWIKAMLNRTAGPKNLALLVGDHNYKEQSRRLLNNAVLTRFALPTLDGSSKDTGYFEITIQPEQIQTSTANKGTDIRSAVGPKQQVWLASNFKFELQNGPPGSRIASIAGFEATQEAPAATGVARFQAATPLELGKLTVAVSMADASDWDTWFHSFVVQGQNGQADEKTATLQLLSPNMKTSLLEFALQGVGIVGARDSFEANSEKIARKTYTLYFEQVALNSTSPEAPTATPAPPPSPPPAAAPTVTEATILPVAATKLQDGETFTISDGTNEPTVFEFDFDGRFTGVPIKVAPEAPAEEVGAAIAEAINGVEETLEISAKLTEEQRIQLESMRADAEGEEKILEFVEDEGFKAQDKVVERAPEGLPAPTGLTATTGEKGEIQLSWKESPGALGYLILFKTEEGGDYLELDKAEGTQITFAGLEPGVTHYFVVRALDGTNESENSEQAVAAAG